MKAGRCIWTSLGIIIVHVLISCSSYDNGGIVQGCAEDEIMFGCKDSQDIVVIKDAWMHQKFFKSFPTACHIAEYNLGFRVESILQYLNKKCPSGRLCKFNLFQDVPAAKFKDKWKEGVIWLDYECVSESSFKEICATTIAEQESWIRNSGYPSYYYGPAACTYTIHVDEGQHIDLTIHDMHLKGIIRPRETACSDELAVTEGQKQLFSECGTLRRPVNIISQQNTLNVTLHSGGVFVHRGFVIHFKAIGCYTPEDPEGGYLSYRNKDYAEFKCADDSLFPDTLKSTRTLQCLRKRKWNMDVPNCVHLEDLLSSGNITKDEYLRYNGSAQATGLSDKDMLYVVIIPSTIMCILVVGNVGILIIIAVCRRKAKNKFEELEEVKEENNASMSNKI